MRKLLLVLLLLAAACARSPDDAGASSSSSGLTGRFAARLASARLVSPEGLAPHLSPDGAWVGFSGPRLRGLSVVAAAGGPARELTDEPGVGYKFAWSPDATELAYVTREDDGTRRLRTVHRDGGAPETIWSVGPGTALPLPHYTAGGRLLFPDGAGRLRARGEAAPLLEGIPPPRFVALFDERGFVLGGDAGVFAAGRGAGPVRTLAAGRRFFDPVASPDGGLLLVRELGPGGSDLWAISRESGERRRLGHFERGCVLPGSALVLAERNEDDGVRITRSELWAMRPDGSDPIKLEEPPGTMPHRLDCARGRDRIAFTDERSGAVWVADVEVQP